MARQFICEDERRRTEVRDHATLNGIDYLEVLDRAYIERFGDETAPERAFRQRTLLVHCLKALTPDDWDGANVRIEGGVRIRPVRVTWVVVASSARLGNLAVSAAEADLIRDHAGPNPDRILVVRTGVAGDYSPYTLYLTGPKEGSGLPNGFDELLSHIDFSFKIDCPSDFDCRPERVCPPRQDPEPVIDYLAKDYATFRQLLLDRLAAVMPDWSERNPADLGVTLVEILAYAADHLSYYQDAVGTEAYLGTARQRVSVRRHARLLDYRMHEGCNARAWTQLRADATNVFIEAGTRLLTHVPEQPARIPAGSRAAAEALAGGPEVFLTMHDAVVSASNNQMYFYTWTDESCCLPKGATRATLRDDPDNRLRLRRGDVVVFQEIKSPANGLEADADPDRRHAVRLTAVNPEAELGERELPDGTRVPTRELPTNSSGTPKEETDELTGQQIVEIEWDPNDALPFPLCVSTEIDGRLERDISAALGNIVFADHGRPVAEDLPPVVPSQRRPYRPILDETGVTYRVKDDPAAAQTGSASRAVQQNPRNALPAVELSSIHGRWVPRPDLLDSHRFDRHFVVEQETDGRAALRFGRPHDRQGRAPPPRVGFRAQYRVGNGPTGNVGPGALAHVVTDTAGIAAVWNPLPAAGGTAPEANERVRLDAPQAFRVQQRAVTVADYGDVTTRHPEVQKAVATRRWTGSWSTLFITVDRKGGRPVDAEFEARLTVFLQRFRQTGHDVEISPPEFVPLHIAMTVCVEPGHFPENVEAALVDAFSNRDLPSGQRGFFHPDHFTFGDPLHLSRVVATAMEVPGVRWVDLEDTESKPNRFRRWGEQRHGAFEKGRIEMAPLEVARLDNDPNRPENGKIEFFMRGEP